MKLALSFLSIFSSFAWAKDSCIETSFQFRLGPQPADVSFRVVCDRKTVWSEHELHIPLNLGNLLHTETKCLLPADVCHLIVYNTNKALAKHNIHISHPPPDSLEMIVGDKQVFHYDGSASYYKLKSEAFCIGCEDQVNNNNTSDCMETNLRLKLDEFPGEIGYRLQCDDQVVWHKPKWTHLVSDGWSFQVLKESSCVPKEACCLFEVEDHWGDGISSPQENKAGSIRLVYEYVFERDITGEDSRFRLILATK